MDGFGAEKRTAAGQTDNLSDIREQAGNPSDIRHTATESGGGAGGAGERTLRAGAAGAAPLNREGNRMVAFRSLAGYLRSLPSTGAPGLKALCTEKESA